MASELGRTSDETLWQLHHPTYTTMKTLILHGNDKNQGTRVSGSHGLISHAKRHAALKTNQKPCVSETHERHDCATALPYPLPGQQRSISPTWASSGVDLAVASPIVAPPTSCWTGSEPRPNTGGLAWLTTELSCMVGPPRGGEQLLPPAAPQRRRCSCERSSAVSLSDLRASLSCDATALLRRDTSLIDSCCFCSQTASFAFPWSPNLRTCGDR